MSNIFQVGNVIVRKPQFVTQGDWKHGDSRVNVREVRNLGFIQEVRVNVGNPTHWWDAPRFDRVTSFAEAAVEVRADAKARFTDPDTSKHAAAVTLPKNLQDQIVFALTGDRKAGERTGNSTGLTGHELSDATGRKLNSVTPRLAELRRAGKIKDSGIRRDGQIVWVLA